MGPGLSPGLAPRVAPLGREGNRPTEVVSGVSRRFTELNERVTTVTVRTSGCPASLPWESRQALLAELQNLDAAGGITRAFNDAGVRRPVELRAADRVLLIDLLGAWSRRLGADDLPNGLRDLRDALRRNTQ